MLEYCRSLEELWREMKREHDAQFPGHSLHPIQGNGKIFKPEFMLVFINPTARNSSTALTWKGPRYPFVGTKHAWRFLFRAGFFDQSVWEEIDSRKEWSPEFAEKVLEHIHGKDLYITNLVKRAGKDATLPDAQKARMYVPLLQREIELVQPHYIVTLGAIPFKWLMNEKIKLGEIFEQTMASGKPKLFENKIGSFKAKIVPCYFPIGRGEPKKAVEWLKLIRTLPQSSSEH